MANNFRRQKKKKKKEKEKRRKKCRGREVSVGTFIFKNVARVLVTNPIGARELVENSKPIAPRRSTRALIKSSPSTRNRERERESIVNCPWADWTKVAGRKFRNSYARRDTWLFHPLFATHAHRRVRASSESYRPWIARSFHPSSLKARSSRKKTKRTHTHTHTCTLDIKNNACNERLDTRTLFLGATNEQQRQKQ